jgi:hypothetical protein
VSVNPSQEPLLAGPDPVADDPEPLAPKPFMETVSAPEAGIAAIIEVSPLEGSTDPAGDGGGVGEEKNIEHDIGV